MDFGGLWCASVGIEIAANVSLWCGMWIFGEVVCVGYSKHMGTLCSFGFILLWAQNCCIKIDTYTYIYIYYAYMWICTYIHNTFHNSHSKVFCEERTNWHVVGNLLIYLFWGLLGYWLYSAGHTGTQSSNAFYQT